MPQTTLEITGLAGPNPEDDMANWGLKIHLRRGGYFQNF